MAKQNTSKIIPTSKLIQSEPSPRKNTMSVGKSNEDMLLDSDMTSGFQSIDLSMTDMYEESPKILKIN